MHFYYLTIFYFLITDSTYEPTYDAALCVTKLVLGWPKSSFVFSLKIVVVALSCLNVILNNFVRLFCGGCHISVHFLKTSELVNFCAAILILKLEENKQCFWHIMLYYFNKGKNTTETHKKDLCGIWRRCCD